MKDNFNALNEIHKGTCMGQDALSFVIDKVEDLELKRVLLKQFDDYDDIAKEIEKVYPKYNNDTIKDTSLMNKAMIWSGMEIKTITNHSDSKIAELIINGINMGIIEGVKIINKKKINNEIKDIVSKFIKMQEKNLDILKEYL